MPVNVRSISAPTVRSLEGTVKSESCHESGLKIIRVLDYYSYATPGIGLYFKYSFG